MNVFCAEPIYELLHLQLTVYGISHPPQYAQHLGVTCTLASKLASGPLRILQGDGQQVGYGLVHCGYGLGVDIPNIDIQSMNVLGNGWLRNVDE